LPGIHLRTRLRRTSYRLGAFSGVVGVFSGGSETFLYKKQIIDEKIISKQAKLQLYTIV